MKAHLALRRCQHRVACSDQVQLCVDDYGPEDGPVVVWLHGLGAGQAQFAPDAARFARLGVRGLVPALRGHGQTGAPIPADHTTLTVAGLADDVTRMVVALAPGRPVCIVGNSMGGIIALELLSRDVLPIQQVVMFGTALALSVPAIGVRALDVVQNVVGRDRLLGWIARKTSQTEGSERRLREMLLAMDPRISHLLQRDLRRYDYRAVARAQAGRLTIIHCGKDSAVNMHLDRQLRALAGVVPVRHMPEAGHCANLDDPVGVRRLLWQIARR